MMTALAEATRCAPPTDAAAVLAFGPSAKRLDVAAAARVGDPGSRGPEIGVARAEATNGVPQRSGDSNGECDVAAPRSSGGYEASSAVAVAARSRSAASRTA